jgi:hypothetical protein
VCIPATHVIANMMTEEKQTTKKTVLRSPENFIDEGIKFPSTQIVNVLPLIWQHVSTSESHLQASSTKYTKEFCINCIRLQTVNLLQLYTIHFVYFYYRSEDDTLNLHSYPVHQ